MLDKVVLSEALVSAIWHIASPPFQLPMPFIFMPDPVGFSLEGFRFCTLRKGTSERLDIFVDVLGPIGWFVELLNFETQGALEFGREALDWGQRNTRREKGRCYSTLDERIRIVTASVISRYLELSASRAGISCTHSRRQKRLLTTQGKTMLTSTTLTTANGLCVLGFFLN
jgi:hypothetical protein